MKLWWKYDSSILSVDRLLNIVRRPHDLFLVESAKILLLESFLCMHRAPLATLYTFYSFRTITNSDLPASVWGIRKSAPDVAHNITVISVNVFWIACRHTTVVCSMSLFLIKVFVSRNEQSLFNVWWHCFFHIGSVHIQLAVVCLIFSSHAP